MINSVKNKSFPVRTLQFLYFLSMGSISPFLGLYLKKIITEPFGSKGLALVGLLFFIQPLVTIPSAPILGFISDKYKISHKLSFLSSLMMLVSAVFFFLPNLFNFSYFGLAIILLIAIGLYGIFSGILVPLIDSETLHYLHSKDGNGSQYGKIRVWGSAGWVISPIIVGFLAFRTDNLSFSIIVFALASSLLCIFSRKGSTYNETKEKIDWRILKKDRPFILFLLFTFILNIATTSSFTFTSWFMDDGNTSLLIMGLAFGLSALPEIPLMLKVDKISKFFGNGNMISLGIAIEGIRLFLFLLVAKTGKTELYILLLCLHGIFWTLYYNGLIQFIDNRAGDNMKATRLSLIALVSAAGAALAGPFGAWIINAWSSFELMKVDGFILILMALIFYIISKKEK